MIRRGFVASWLLTVMLVSATSLVLATHMVQPAPYEYWDVGNDHSPNPSVSVDADGSGWTQTKLDRLTAATSEWSTKTDFKPFRVVTGGNDFFVDGTIDPYCVAPNPNAPASTCVHSDYRSAPGMGSRRDIFKVTTTMNPSLPAPYTWWYGSTHTGANYALDFQGVTTHELGHWVHLIDVYDPNNPPPGCNYGTGMYTMCGLAQTAETSADDTWRQRSLTTDDISAANFIY